MFKKLKCFRFGCLVLTISLLFLSVQSAQAGNPLVEGGGMSDPHARVFNDTVYLYCGHDDTPEDKTWVMKEWRVYSSTDLINWKHESTILPKDNYMGEGSSDCWAADAATRNGKYYFYFSDRNRSVGVMVSDSPIGPFKDPLGKPLAVPNHDPTLFVDDDKDCTPYLVYGHKKHGGFRIAKMNEDMISTAEEPELIGITGKEWEKAPKWMDKSYLFKHEDTYYLSWGRDYAISENVYGPYESVGAVGNGHYLNQYAHGSFFWWKGQFYHTWCYYTRKGFKYRESIMTYCHFDDEGNIVTDTGFLDQHFANGVGQYNASWEKIEAEWYYEKTPELKKSGNKADGFFIDGFLDNSFLRFANVHFDEPAEKLTLNVSGDAEGECIFEIRLGSPDGKLVGKIMLGEVSQTENASCSLQAVSGVEDLYLVFKGNENSYRLDSITFKK